jgi:hypothetical protein
MSPTAHVALAVAGIACALALPRELRVRLLTALAVAPVAIDGPPSWTLVLAGGLVAAALARPALGAAPQLEGIQRHLEWCRRRDDRAHLLWVHAPDASPEAIAAAMTSFRVTDNVALLHEGEGGDEIVAMVDDVNFSQEGLTIRLRRHLGERPGIGWAAFPQDGVTLEALFAHARTAAVASTVRPSTEVSTQLRVPVGRLGTTTASPAPGVPAQSSNQG